MTEKANSSIDSQEISPHHPNVPSCQTLCEESIGVQDHNIVVENKNETQSKHGQILKVDQGTKSDPAHFFVDVPCIEDQHKYQVWKSKTSSKPISSLAESKETKSSSR